MKPMTSKKKICLGFLALAISFTELADARNGESLWVSSEHSITTTFISVRNWVIKRVTKGYEYPVRKVENTKYKNCIEEMPKNLEIYYTSSCNKQLVSSGRSCLEHNDRLANLNWRAKNPQEFNSFVSSLQINDNGNSQACIRYQNGVFKWPQKKFVQRTMQLSAFIKKTAQYFKIDPLTIACAFSGDATATSLTYPNQNSYYNPMIQARPVMEAKEYLTNADFDFSNPPQPNEYFIQNTRMTALEMESIRSTALIIKHAELAYLEQNFTEKELTPEILTSIYHMGVLRGEARENSAIKKRQNNEKLNLSFLGLLCLKHKSILKEALR